MVSWVHLQTFKQFLVVNYVAFMTSILAIYMVNFEFDYADHDLAGIFKKVGDMTFILNTDLKSDDFEEGKRKKRNAVLDTKKLWPSGVVPYEISSYFDG